MVKLNGNFFKLQKNYLFAETEARINAFRKNNPDRRLAKLGVGDVTLPICKTVITAMQKAVADMGDAKGFKGYAPSQGYAFLREKIARHYEKKSVFISPDEIFVSDGTKSDLSNVLDLFDGSTVAAIPDPVYPVYADVNVMAGRPTVFLNGNSENGFCPLPSENLHADIVYICSPNNPTGAVYDKNGLKKWVDWANGNGAILLFDGAYGVFISEDVPTSIFEIDGAKSCAIEFCSLSKTAGFTGLRCGWTVFCNELTAGGTRLKDLWARRQATKFNGVCYPVQKGAEAVFSSHGWAEILQNVAVYRQNAEILLHALLGKTKVFGGKNSPYVWFECPEGENSWEFFDRLLQDCGVVGTPGAGFGKNGENYFRLSAFSSRDDVIFASDKLKYIFEKG